MGTCISTPLRKTANQKLLSIMVNKENSHFFRSWAFYRLVDSEIVYHTKLKEEYEDRLTAAQRNISKLLKERSKLISDEKNWLQTQKSTNPTGYLDALRFRAEKEWSKTFLPEIKRNAEEIAEQEEERDLCETGKSNSEKNLKICQRTFKKVGSSVVESNLRALSAFVNDEYEPQSYNAQTNEMDDQTQKLTETMKQGKPKKTASSRTKDADLILMLMKEISGSQGASSSYSQDVDEEDEEDSEMITFESASKKIEGAGAIL